MRRGIVVFDIGGTWFRSGVYSKDLGLTHQTKIPAYNYKNTLYSSIFDLQLKLVDYLVERAQFHKGQGNSIQGASISMGAALNGHTGRILNSGPLWGPECEAFDLIRQLKKRAPDIDWVITNDVSASLLRHVEDPDYKRVTRINLITVSSGIACRTFDQKGQYIPLNRSGIQGEIGHTPIHFSLFGETITEDCDCGGANHLNAFASGRGIVKILRRLSNTRTRTLKSSQLLNQLRDLEEIDMSKVFFNKLNEGNSDAIKILDQVTFPVAEMIVHLLTIDAEIEKIIMTGGVVHAVERHYMDSLLANLEKIGLYQDFNPSTFFKETIKLGVDDDSSGLLGAAIAYENRIR